MTTPKIDLEKIAKALGASHLTKERRVYRRTVKQNSEEIALRELSNEDLANKSLLGSSYGIDFFHCLSIASRHCENFLDRVTGYYFPQEDETSRIFREETQYPIGIRVDFYEDKKDYNEQWQHSR